MVHNTPHATEISSDQQTVQKRVNGPLAVQRPHAEKCRFNQSNKRGEEHNL